MTPLLPQTEAQTFDNTSTVDVEQVEVELFRASKDTHRFRKNQRVWVAMNFANHLWIYFKWRGKGRYVKGVIDKFDGGGISEIRKIVVDKPFADTIHNSYC